MSTPPKYRSGSVLLMAFGGIALIGILYAVLTMNAERPASEPRASAPGPDKTNTLSDAERAAGWQLLFDGESLDGWRGYQRDSAPEGWTVKDGALHFRGEAPNSTSILTTDQFDHFELRLEWKIAPEGNSGIIYRATEVAGSAARSGLEYQVLDNAVHAGDSAPEREAGALYGLYAPSQDVTRPVGEYNEARIVVRGSHVEHWMNGTKLLETEIGSESWTKRMAESKFADWPHFAEATTGHIVLQDHNHPVWYRDIKLRPLSPDS